MLRNFRRWWQIRTGRVDTPLDGGVPFWMVSFLFHVVLLLLLAKTVIPSGEKKLVELTVDVEADELVELDAPIIEVEFEELIPEDIGSDSEDEFDIASNEAPTVDVVNEEASEIDDSMFENGDFLADESSFEPTGEIISKVAVKGTVGHAVTGATGAVDRITEEILSSLDERKTLVVWMFDQSASLMQQRSLIVKRLDKIYKELGILESEGNEAFSRHQDKPLLTDVYAFGQDLNSMMRKPTDDLKVIKDSIRQIELDRSGIENVFTSVSTVVNRYKSMRRVNAATGDRERNVLIVVISDEAGDDLDQLDNCVKACSRYEVPVYVIGVPAPFGRRETLVKWVDPDPQYDQTPQMASVSQGPESAMPECIQLDYTSDLKDLEMMDSGFGPFHLTRLCYETGGIYFSVHPNRRMNRRVRMAETSKYTAYLSHFFDPEIMKKYKPDYVTHNSYIQRAKTNKAREALLRAAQYTSTGVLVAPDLVFEKLDEARFVREVSTAQQAAAIVEPKLEQLYQILAAGEKDREREDIIRWQAGYDLAMGRVMAAKVRANAYNAMLAMAKTKLKFKEEKNNTWVLKPANSISTGSAAEKMADKARVYLNKVINEHPKTPWALLAKRELDTPIGWEWTEKYTRPPQPRQARPQPNNNNNNQRPMPQPRQNAQPKTKRPPPKL